MRIEKYNNKKSSEDKKALSTANDSSEMFQMANLVQVIEVPVGIMNDLELGPLAYLTVLKLRVISTDYDLNTASLGFFNHNDVEQLINLKDSDTDTFILSPSTGFPVIMLKQLLIDKWHQQLSHIDEENLIKMLQELCFEIAIISSKKLSFCTMCIKAKYKCASYKNAPLHCATCKGLKI
ncbi:hypothetical protein PAAG_07128 [Paracoccidioides lutzii Pb01]|uniref:Uncharacterized protein n=1 Tax=Paracoccidioides lutzii (strain ATCC MYA-826 / Pb01) TaxID=502779 RepID=C1H8N7_PARBA|nr:hypothetical protein PAAG_07128 [Paracoccidioides lutzii Pb01]EEH36710.1 hypothetical protein PAAG_07128 [Paracoccidioides lutzii Pb01]